MKKPSKIDLVTYLVVLIVILVGLYIIFKPNTNSNPDSNLAKCIGENSQIFIATGCSACAAQEELFGEDFQYLNVIDCAKNPQECSPIIENQAYSVPTWIINGEKYKGVRSLETLKTLTGC